MADGVDELVEAVDRAHGKTWQAVAEWESLYGEAVAKGVEGVDFRYAG